MEFAEKPVRAYFFGPLSNFDWSSGVHADLCRCYIIILFEWGVCCCDAGWRFIVTSYSQRCMASCGSCYDIAYELMTVFFIFHVTFDWGYL